MATEPISPAADYHSEPVTGKRWLRAYRVIINNPYLGQPTVAIDEEQVTEVGDARSARFNETLGAAVDLAAVIDLIDPVTGAPLGAQMTHAQVYVALYSLYRALGATRDAATP